MKIGNIDLGDFPLLLAPMEDVSDPPFRALCKEQGADVVYTEFVSSEGLIRNAAKSVMKLDIYEKERPVGIQIFGANLDSMLQSVEIVERSKPDIIDINFGCPVKKVVCKMAGAGILQDIDRMVKDAEKYEAEDKERLEIVQTKNEADHLVYTVDKTLKEFGDKVSEEEANLQEGKISVESPIGKGLLGKKKGEKVTVKIPSGEVIFKVINISL